MIKELKKAYQGKKVFLTGHTGFKGSWLLKILSMLGAEVKGYSLEPQTDTDLYHLVDGNSLCTSCIADIRDRELLIDSVLSFQPDFVFHLAAQPLVRYSYKFPSETFEVNAIGTANLLDAVRLLDKQVSTVLITTDKVYHNNEWAYPYRENDKLGGYDPYSASKACAEIIIDSYRNSFFSLKNYSSHLKGLAVARAGNVIGGGDWSKDRLIPDIARAFSLKKEVLIRNPSSVRPWQHVLEPLLGYLQLGVELNKNPENFSQAYNFGPYINDSLPVIEMVKLAIESWGTGSYKILNDSTQPHEAGLLKLDISKALTEVKWAPKFNAEIAVSATVEWYKAFFDNPKGITAFTETQIHTFLGND